MKVLVVGNVHLICTKDNEYYSSSVYSYDFYKRYLNIFDEVKVIGKTKHVDSVDEKAHLKISGPQLEVAELPWYQGMSEMCRLLPKLIHIYRHLADDCDCCILRIAQVESFLFYMFTKKRFPFCVEIVNDPETFGKKHNLIRTFSVYMTKKMARKANGASYVTEHFLQSKYPCKAILGFKDGFESHYSSIDLDEEGIAKSPIRYGGGEFRIVHVSNAINNDDKGHTTLIKAFAVINKEIPETSLTIIGDGSKLEEYKKLAENLGVSDRVTFSGRISNKAVLLDELRNSNLMIMPTKMEGLPRTIIEAMSVGLPCLSSPTAGVPELIERKYLFSSDDFNAFAQETVRLIGSFDELYEMSARNIEESKKYCKSVLNARRSEFYLNLRKAVNDKQKG